MEGFHGLTEQDVAAAAPSIFHLPDGEQIRHRKSAVDKFLARAPFEVLGQEQAIRTIGARMKSHVLGVRDVDRPLALLLPGPTGVGKTELMMKFALAMNMPFFHVEGAQFSESHTVARLIGSPSGYVGPDKGILYVFAEDNAAAIVFFDEIEKMHPDVYTALMNYFDAGILTAGNGETVRRPGHVIVGAANAGAEKLHRHMSERQVKDLLAEAFTDRYGNKRPGAGAPLRGDPDAGPGEGALRRGAAFQPGDAGQAFRLHQRQPAARRRGRQRGRSALRGLARGVPLQRGQPAARRLRRRCVRSAHPHAGAACRARTCSSTCVT